MTDIIALKIKRLKEMQGGGVTGNTYPLPQGQYLNNGVFPFNQEQPSATGLTTIDPTLFNRQTVQPLNLQSMGVVQGDTTIPYQAPIPSFPDANVQYNTTTNTELYNPYTGVNTDTALFGLGQSFGYQGDQKGANTVRGIGAAAKILTSGARTFLSGLGYEKANQRAYNDYQERQYRPELNYQSLQAGGEITNAQAMTGAYMPETAGMPVAEAEHGEYIQNSQTGDVQQIVGEKHENGGVPISAPPESKVLSDFTKIGAAKAKLLKKQLDMKNVKASDTYASVMEKYNKKIGFNSLIEEQEKVIEQVSEQSEEQIQETTADLNMNYLSDKMTQLEQEKEILKPVQDEAFNTLFEQQEKSKPKDKESEVLQTGGTITDLNVIALAQQYNLTPERIIELMSAQAPVMQGGGYTIDRLRRANPLENPALYVDQPANDTDWNTFGQLLQTDPTGAIQNLTQTNPRLAAQYFPNGQINRDTAGEFQQAVNADYDLIQKDAEILLGDNPELLNQLKTSIQNDRFQNDPQSIKGLDAKLGNYTLTRPNYALPLVTPEIKKELNDKGIFYLNDLREKDPEMYKQIVGDRTLASNAYIEEVIPTAPQEIPATDPTIINRNVTQYEVPLLPQDYILPPTPQQAVYKADVSLNRVDPVKISPEANLIEADRQRQSVSDALAFLPDSQRATTIASLLGQTQNTTNQAITAAETQNAQAQYQADIYNAQVGDKESLLGEQFALDYENRAFRTQAAQEAQLRSYFNELNDQQRFNFGYVDRRKAFNEAPINYKITNSGIEFDGQGTKFSVPASTLAGTYASMTPEQKKAYLKAYAASKGRTDGRTK